MIVGALRLEGCWPEKRVDVPPASFAGLAVGVVAPLEAQEAQPKPRARTNIEGRFRKVGFIGLLCLAVAAHCVFGASESSASGSAGLWRRANGKEFVLVLYGDVLNGPAIHPGKVVKQAFAMVG